MLKEYTQPVTKPIDGDKNVFSVLVERAERKPDEPLVSYKDGAGSWRSFTAAEFRDKVIALAKGLIARGVMPGDAVSIISSTSWQWLRWTWPSCPSLPHRARLRDQLAGSGRHDLQ